MLVSKLIKELTDYLVEHGDKQVAIGLLSENGDVQFVDDVDTYDSQEYFEIFYDADDINKFQEDIQVLFEQKKKRKKVKANPKMRHLVTKYTECGCQHEELVDIVSGRTLLSGDNYNDKIERMIEGYLRALDYNSIPYILNSQKMDCPYCKG